MSKFLDELGLAHVWTNVKNYIDSKISDAGGSSASGPIQWEDINGRPDLSNVSSMKVAQIVLLSVAWDDNNRQAVIVNGVLEDENQQLIIPVPKEADKDIYHNTSITCVSQDTDELVFYAKNVPEEDLHVNIFIFGATEVSEEYAGEFVWWSPQMTSNSNPSPYVVSSSPLFQSSNEYAAWHALDSNTSTTFVSNATGIYFMFDFGAPTVIKGIRLFPQNTRLDSFPISGVIDGSNDASNWTEIESFSNLPDPTDWEFREHIFDKPVKYRYYRLSNLDCSYKYHVVAFSELEFYKMEGLQ